MSAVLLPRGGETKKLGEEEETFKYEQKVPIPSYLIAVAGGELSFAVSWAVCVW